MPLYEMKKLLRRFALTLTRDIRLHCVSSRINWTKLFFIWVMLTMAGAIFQMLTLPYPLNTWLISQPVSVSSYESFNGTMKFTENSSEAKFEQFQVVRTTPTVSLNLSNELIQSSQVSEIESASKGRKRSRRRKRNTELVDHPKETSLPPPPPPRRVPSSLQRYVWSLSPNKALQYAKKEIENAPMTMEDSHLYAPIFKNVSIFKRSYELMELILKVYIYPDGKRPIFHEPNLRGIYASEGWFMKLMEANRQFVTRDPEKAHLFYLPYSARQLQMALYVPDSHNMKPLSLFLRDYVNSIAARLPFWNRTRGADHFLVACHDWGPYTVNEHEELSRYTIKALCNADLSEGVFKAGKDVSLPETIIRTPRKPLRYVGGRRVSQRPILAFFAGNMHGRVRPILLKHWSDKDEDMKVYGPLPNRVSRKMSYIQHMKSSKYCLCPMGYEVNSPRIIEAIYYECVPVIIADHFALPLGEVLDWSTFSVVVAEKDIPKLKEILLAIPMRRYLTMQINVKMVQRHFLWNPKPLRFDLFHMVLHSIWFNRLNQIEL